MQIIPADCIDSAMLVIASVVGLLVATGIIPTPWREPWQRRILAVGSVVLLMIAAMLPFLNAAARNQDASSSAAPSVPATPPSSTR